MPQPAMIAREGDPAETRRLMAGGPHRPGYHFLPPDSQMQDIDAAMYWRGTYHMFYIRHPVFPGSEAHWGHTTSTDLVHWTDLPYALVPETDYDRHGIWSGHGVDDDGVATLIYTGKAHPGTCRTDPGVVAEVQCIATCGDDDLLTWTKHPANPVIARPPADLTLTGFRDPCVWRQADGWHMLVGSGFAGVGGTVLHYRSPDLVQWECLRPLLTGREAETGWMWEVPDFFPLGDQWVLSFVPILSDAGFSQRAMYYVGRYEGGRFTPERLGLLDSGRFYLAARSFVGPDDRRLVYAWLLEGRSVAPRVEAGWSGVAALPRELTLGADGGLRVAPVPELQALRGAHHQLSDLTLEPGGTGPAFGVAGHQLELALEVDRGDADAVELRVLCSPDGDEVTTVCYDWVAGELSLDTTRSGPADDGDLWGSREVADAWEHPERRVPITERPTRLQAGERLRLHVFVDHSVVEVFINERACITSRAYPTRADSTGLQLAARGGRAWLRRADVWESGSIW